MFLSQWMRPIRNRGNGHFGLLIKATSNLPTKPKVAPLMRDSSILVTTRRNFVTNLERKPFSKDFVIRQFFDHNSYGYTYILADAHCRTGVIIDPLAHQLDRDIELVKELAINLKYALKTHFDAKGDQCFEQLKKLVPECLTAVSAKTKSTADVLLHHGEILHFGRHSLEVRATPGHTNGCLTYVCHEQGIAFTGDTLLIRGCGRTDLTHGDPETLYDSIYNQIFSLPDIYRLYPGRDYNGRTLTTVGEEKLFNPRLSIGKEEFVNLMKTSRPPSPGKDGKTPGTDHGLYKVNWI